MESREQGLQPEIDKTREQEAWQRRPFARSFDLIAAEYGWTDDQILDLTMARMRQVREVIWERQSEDRRRDLTVREAEVRILAEFIAASGGSKAGVKAARKIQLVPPETDPNTGEAKREIRPIPFESAQRWFPGE